MVVLYQSQTCPINPPNALPILTIDEVWEVMMLKCRKPQLFVAPMSGSMVLEENPTFMKRSVTFKEGMGPPGGEVIEDLQIRKPWKVPPLPTYLTVVFRTRRLIRVLGQVDFYNLDSGAFINNTISQGKDETDLYLTFYFEWPYPKLEEGSADTQKTEETLWAMAGQTVQHTIDYARDLAREGKLGKGLEL